MIIGVSARRSGSHLVAFDNGNVVAIERHDNLERLAARLRELHVESATSRFVIDMDQRGKALALLLGSGPWSRYTKVGPDRRELTTAVDVAIANHAFRVGKDVRNASDLARALENVAKDVSEDGSPESSMVVALAIALRYAPAGPARIW